MKPASEIATDFSMTLATASATPDLAPSVFADYYELTKPRMNMLVLATTLVGYGMATSTWMDWPRLINTLLGTALCAAGAAALNMWMEVEPDRLMPRTRRRPLPAGRLRAPDVLGYGTALALGGSLYLTATVNLLTATLGALTIALYVFIYTPLKRVTSLNTVIGAIPGAIPPVMGFTATTGKLSLEAAVVFAILFVWQMPHFLAIAILYKDDYAAAGFKMLPVVDTDRRFTNVQILLYGLTLVPISMLPTLMGMTGTVYAICAVTMGVAFLYFGVNCARSKTRKDALYLFLASIIYLPILLAVMMLDKN